MIKVKLCILNIKTDPEIDTQTIAKINPNTNKNLNTIKKISKYLKIIYRIMEIIFQEEHNLQVKQIEKNQEQVKDKDIKLNGEINFKIQ